MFYNVLEVQVAFNVSTKPELGCSVVSHHCCEPVTIDDATERPPSSTAQNGCHRKQP